MLTSDFNSQPHKEADETKRFGTFVLSISTHSLTRRLTILSRKYSLLFPISTHSLTRRLTHCFVLLLCISLFISTHSLTRRLTYGCFANVYIFHISTHSLTRRLTGFLEFIIKFIDYFNSQPHKEADIIFSQ